MFRETNFIIVVQSTVNLDSQVLVTSASCSLTSLQKTAVSPWTPCSSPLGMFCEEEHLWLSDRNSILMTYINVYITNLVGMWFQEKICSILRFSWVILVKSVLLIHEWAPAKLKCLFSRRIYSSNLEFFCYRFNVFTFDLCGHLSVVCHLYTIAKTL